MLPLPWEIDEESERKREMGKRENRGRQRRHQRRI